MQFPPFGNQAWPWGTQAPPWISPAEPWGRQEAPWAHQGLPRALKHLPGAPWNLHFNLACPGTCLGAPGTCLLSDGNESSGSLRPCPRRCLSAPEGCLHGMGRCFSAQSESSRSMVMCLGALGRFPFFPLTFYLRAKGITCEHQGNSWDPGEMDGHSRGSWALQGDACLL